MPSTEERISAAQMHNTFTAERLALCFPAVVLVCCSGTGPRSGLSWKGLLEGRRSFAATPPFFNLKVLVSYGVPLLKEANEMWFTSM
ncbi:hypothetical protein PVAP13_8KG014120 [Panicum virgatum]|uniref:Uncharacterized protein n=1 Tax=Panicum virgatum TaxID=38727 RepID=A0A8T0PD88_PANVG|nr:hypothetical protein PVAP13_8KG014120 [Panicum virgatum]